MMAKSVSTVLGPISPDELGITLIHEHILAGNMGWFVDETRYPFDSETATKAALKVMGELGAYRVKTYVDATPKDIGRNVEFLKQIAEKSKMNIICSTGLYTDATGASCYFKYLASLTDGVKEIYELFVKEVTEGIENTGIKAGVIKIATGLDTISPYETMVFKAAARVQRECKVPIITHTEAGTMGPEQADLLISEGADPKHIMIGHAGGCADMRYHTNILDRGVYLAFDRMGLDSPMYHAGPDSLRLACIIGLISMGYTDRLLISHDYVVHWVGRNAYPLLPKESIKNLYPTHIFKDIIPALKDAGITDSQINTILVENPRRIFQFDERRQHEDK
jgi:phosphotriesterase-related protein